MNRVMLAQILVTSIGLYLALGLVFAIAFVIRGARKIDPAAAQGTLGFRLIIMPGAVLLWPWLAKRWRHGGPASEERNAHRLAALRVDVKK